MPEEPRLTPEELAVQLRQHLDSLRAAGVEWLPTAPPPAPVPAVPPASEVAPMSSSLFDGHDKIKAADAPPARNLTLDERHQELALLSAKCAQCTRCKELARTRTQTVFGEGALNAPLCFVGEAPGADEDATGRPFVGAAGQLLNRIIAACGMKREEVYICNVIRCRPPGNRLPLPDEAANCREYLEGTLELVRPEYICCLGACAAQNLLGTTLSIGKLRGRFHDYRGIPVLCTYHPAYLLRNPSAKKDVWDDMKKLLAKMGRSVP